MDARTEYRFMGEILRNWGMRISSEPEHNILTDPSLLPSPILSAVSSLTNSPLATPLPETPTNPPLITGSPGSYFSSPELRSMDLTLSRIPTLSLDD